MENKVYENISEVVNTYQLENGLQIEIISKKDFFKTFVYLGVNFGSLTNKFIPLEETVLHEVPLGIAHFLEHKLFANADGTDAANLLAALGLEVNAYTDYIQTVYLFNGAKNITEGIKILLDFVLNPYFTAKNIAAEKNIIVQELKMYLDIPGDRLHNGLMKNLFINYPIKYDIGGTIKEVKKISKADLEKCHSTFYHPGNMKLVIVGNVNSDEIVEFIEDNQKIKKYPHFFPIVRDIELEDGFVYRAYSSCKMDITLASVAVGVKIPAQVFARNQVIIEEILLKIVLSAYVGPSSNYYQKLLDKELVSNHLHYSVYFDNYCGYIKLNADSRYPRLLRKSLLNRLKSLNKISMTEKMFNRFKKAVLGSFIKALNNLDFLAMLIVEYNFKNCDILESVLLLEKLKVVDIKTVLKYFSKESLASYIIFPSDEKPDKATEELL